MKLICFATWWLPRRRKSCIGLFQKSFPQLGAHQKRLVKSHNSLASIDWKLKSSTPGKYQVGEAQFPVIFLGKFAIASLLELRLAQDNLVGLVPKAGLELPGSSLLL